MSELPEDDQPDGGGLVPTDDEAAAAADVGDLTDPRNPMTTAIAFFNALTADGAPDRGTLRKVCTPESWDAWGDFSDAVEAIAGRGLATRADPPGTGEPGVRYAKLVELPDPNQSMQSTGEIMVPALIITLQWRPTDGYWRVHGLGDYIRPEDLPPAR
jgi:hypothetical protein